MAATKRLTALTSTVMWLTMLMALMSQSTFAFNPQYSAQKFSQNITTLLDTLLSNYDRRLRPGYGGPPTPILVNMNVRSMGPFSERHESYAMQLYLRQEWQDSRLRFNYTDLGRGELSMNWIFAAKLWKPDTFFINGKNSYTHKITAPNMFIRLRHDGKITWSMRLTVRATCKMHLRKFPLDTQICPLIMGSFGYTAHDMVYSWDKAKLVTVDSDLSIAQYELVNITTSQAKVVVRRIEEISTLSVRFHLTRQTGFFMLQVYVPCILIVCCSWVAFWITPKDAAGRVCLGATTVLSLTTLGFGGRSAGPPVSYATALDYFVILCFTFVFTAALEFAAIQFFQRSGIKRRKKLEHSKQLVTERMTAGKEKEDLFVKVPEEGGAVKESLRRMLKVPLTVVPLADEEAVEEKTPEQGLKQALQVPLTVVSTTACALQKDFHDRSGEDMRKEVLILSTPEFIDRGITGEAQRTSPSDAARQEISIISLEQNMVTKRVAVEEKETVVVDVTPTEPSEPPPPPQVTVWQLLTRMKFLISSISPEHIIPGEEEITDRVLIIDLVSRRLFPVSFFTLLSVYWVLFNYYITDEFPEQEHTPSDGLIVT